MTEQSFNTSTGQRISIEVRLSDDKEKCNIILSIHNGEHYAMACLSAAEYENIHKLVAAQALNIVADELSNTVKKI